MKDFDAIVIGAGNGGLTAATALQRGGARTLLLERHNIPGGCATSFVRGEFEFEVALHQLSGLGTEDKPFIMRKIFSDLGVMDKVEFVQEGELYRFVKPGVIDITLPASWKGLNTTLSERFPAEADNVTTFLKTCETVCMESFLALPKARKMNSEDMLLKMCPTYVKYGQRNSKDVLNEFFDDELLKTVIAAYWCYIGQAPKDIPFVDLAVMIYAYAAFKPWHIKGGSQALSSALLESFMEAGGEVRFNCAAEKILTDSSSDKPVVQGVRTEFGEELSCDYVMSNASSPVTYYDLLDTDKNQDVIKQDFKSRRMGTSAFVVYLGLDCTPDKLGINSASTFIIEEMDEEKIHDHMETMEAPIASMMTCYNFDDPTFAPPGKSQVVLVCLQYGEAWENVPAEDYAETKYDYANKLIDYTERAFPNIREHIQEMEVGTPLTMMRYLNTPGGAIYGFQQHHADGELYRDRLKSVSGLFQAGSWESMGGFQPTYMAGNSTGRAILKKLKAQKEASATTHQETSHA